MLDPSKHQIRLIKLSPGQIDDRVCCSLFIASLEERPEYEALSYVWGDPAERLSILLGEHEFQVTTNLRSALQHLRFQDRTRVLWIDAISINQDDVAEREAQVQQMGEIYKSAQIVLVWLGPRKEDSDEAMDQILELGSADHLSAILDKHRIEDGPWPTDYFRPLQHWIGCHWFRCLWVIQEIALSRTALLYYGNRCISWDDLKKAIAWLSRHSDCCIDNLSIPARSRDRLKILHGVVEPTYTIRCYLVERGNKMSLTLLCGMLRHLSCRDDRDRIYSLLGICEETVIQPDYSISTADLYRKVTLALIADSGTLDVIAQAGRLRAEHSLPFWVPDWKGLDQSDVPSNGFPLLDRVQLSACGSTRVNLIDLGNEGLSLQGIHTDTVWKTLPVTTLGEKKNNMVRSGRELELPRRRFDDVVGEDDRRRPET